MSASKVIKYIIYAILVVLLIVGIKGYDLYKKAFAANIFTGEQKEMYFFIPTGSDYTYVISQIDSLGLAKNLKNLEWAATRKNYPNHIYPGRYLIKNRMSNNELINLLRSGQQKPLQLTFNNLRTIDEFSAYVASILELNADTLNLLIHDTGTLNRYGMNEHTIKCMFIPNTYEVYWNTSAEAFIKKMNTAYEEFWTKKRDKKAKAMGMTREEVITLASIVNEETRKNDEKERIAGVYVNRLNKGMRLQADPTVVYAVGDFTIRRVLKKHYKIDSPYNTYKNSGLPPGPICMPDISSIDAVLDYEKHKYIYFCAKADFSGYHAFAKTLSEHNKNARAYQRELNKRRIYR